MYRECKISEITKSSEKLRGFFMHKEGVQKVFGTLDLFVSLLETEIKYPILQGGILPFWTPSLFFVLLNDPSELVAFLLRPWSVAERAEEEGLHFYLESII